MSVKMIDSQIVVAADMPLNTAPVVIVDPAMPLPANVAKDAARFAGIMAAGGDISMPLADLPPAPVMPSIANADADAQVTARAGTLADIPHEQGPANTAGTASDGTSAAPGNRPAVSSQNTNTASVATTAEGDAGVATQTAPTPTADDTPDVHPAQVRPAHEEHPIQGGKRASASPEQPQQVATDSTEVAPSSKAPTDKNATPADEGPAPQPRTADAAHAVTATKTKGSRAVLTPAQMQARDHKRKMLGLDGGLPGQVQGKEAPTQAKRASASIDSTTTTDAAAAVAAAGAVVAAQPVQIVAAAASPAMVAGVKATTGAERSAAAREQHAAVDHLDHPIADHSSAAATTAEAPAQHQSQAPLHAQGPAHAADAALAHSHAAIFTSGAAPIANTHAQGPAHAADAAIEHAQAPIFKAAAAAAAAATPAAVTDPVVADPVVADPVVAGTGGSDPIVTDPVATDPVVVSVTTAPIVSEPIAADPFGDAPFAIEMLDAEVADAQAPSDSDVEQVDIPPGTPPAPVQIQREQLVAESIVAQIQATEMHIAAVNIPESLPLEILKAL